MPFTFNPLSGKFDIVKDTSGLVPYTGATADVDLGAFDLEATELRIKGTIDHTITNSSDDLIFTNPNSNKNIIFRVNDGGTTRDFVKIDAAAPRMTLDAGSGGANLDSTGQLNLTGTMTSTIIGVGMTMNPTISGSAYAAVQCSPLQNSSATVQAFRLQPTYSASVDREMDMLLMLPPAHIAGKNDYFKTFTSSGETRQFLAFGSSDASSVTYRWLQMGGAITSLESGYTLPTFIEEMIVLTGGVSRILGTSGSFNQKGIKFTGFGTMSGLTASDSVYGIHADGGLFSFKSDYGTNNKMLFGAGEDAAIGYDGTDFVIDTALVGTGVLKLANATNWTANGTNTVTISNVAPAGVGTATISQWLTVKDNAGTVYYLPAWT